MKTWMLSDDWSIDPRKLEDEWLVFHGGDGQTHRFSGVAAQVFDVLWGNRSSFLNRLEISQLAGNTAKDEIDEDSIEKTLSMLTSLQLLKTIG